MWRRCLRVPWTARRSNQLILKEINPEYSLEELMLKTEAPILWPSNTDVKNQPIGKDPDAQKDWRQKEKGAAEDEMLDSYHQLNWTWIWTNSGWFLKDRETWCDAVHGVAKSPMWLSNWTTTTSVQIFQCITPLTPPQQSLLLLFVLYFLNICLPLCPHATGFHSRDWFLCNPNSSPCYCCHLFTLVFPEITFAQVFFLLKHAKQWLYFDGCIASGFYLPLMLFCIFWAFTVHMYYLLQKKK